MTFCDSNSIRPIRHSWCADGSRRAERAGHHSLLRVRGLRRRVYSRRDDGFADDEPPGHKNRLLRTAAAVDHPREDSPDLLARLLVIRHVSSNAHRRCDVLRVLPDAREREVAWNVEVQLLS